MYAYQNAENNDPQIKKYKQIFEHTETYNNTKISFTAEILAIDRINQTLRVFIQERPYTYPQVHINTANLTIDNLQKGDLIDVIAIVHAENKMTATNIWRNEPWKDNLIYLRSLPAIPFALYLFFRTWKFNNQTWRFERRKKNA